MSTVGVGGNLSKLNTGGCTTTNFPLSNGIKTISVFQRLHGEIGRTNSDVQKRVRQTKTQRFSPPRRRLGGRGLTVG